MENGNPRDFNIFNAKVENNFVFIKKAKMEICRQGYEIFILLMQPNDI